MAVTDNAKLTTSPQRSNFLLKNKKNTISTPSIVNLLRLRTRSLNPGTTNLKYATYIQWLSHVHASVIAKPKAEH